MVPVHVSDIPYDPVELLDNSLNRAWRRLCQAFDVNANLPDLQTLFKGTTTLSPQQAAENVLAAMLMDIMECVGRFSPWYRLPARAYGLTSMRDCTTNQIHWILAPEAIQKWQDILVELSTAIEKNSGLIHAMIVVEDLMSEKEDDQCISVSCGCTPPRVIRLQRSIYENADLVCNLCRQPFTST